MRKFLAGIAVMAFVSVQAPANAATFYCELDPKLYLAVGSDGNVVTAIKKSTGFSITAICNLRSDATVTAQACGAWYSTLLTMRMSTGTALPHFNNADPSNAGHTSCESFQSWDAHLPYFMLLK